jgi:hypothetical protein
MSGIQRTHNNGPALDDDDATFRDHEGWIRVSRRMRNHWLVGFGIQVAPADPDLPTYSHAEAFQFLIMECAYDGRTVTNGGRKMQLEPGQLLGATSWLAAKWNWTPAKVRWFLEKLEADDMITTSSPGARQDTPVDGEIVRDRMMHSQDGSKKLHSVKRSLQHNQQNNQQKGKQKGTEARIITICKYALYQLSHRQPEQTSGPVLQLAPQPATQHAHNLLTTCSQPESNNRTIEQSNKEGRKEEYLPTNSAYTSARAPAPVSLSVEEMMVEDARRWMGLSVPEVQARKWLATTLSAFGPQFTIEAYQLLVQAQASGQPIAAPLAYWSKTAGTLRDNARRRSVGAIAPNGHTVSPDTVRFAKPALD